MSWFDSFFASSKSETTAIVQKVAPLEEFERVINRVSSELGISNLSSRPMVKNSLKTLAREYAIGSEQAFLERYDSDATLHQKVINALTVNETYFLRERASLDWLVEYIQSQSYRLRVLSSPCSNGAEVYSILMLLAQKDRALLKRVEMVGIDVNDEALHLAKEVIYSKRALYYMDDTLRQNYFIAVDDSYKFTCTSDVNITFYKENIFRLDANKYGRFDVVLSRNLFIYFDDATRKKALQKLHSVLEPSGVLILGHADFVETKGLFEKLATNIYKKI